MLVTYAFDLPVMASFLAYIQKLKGSHCNFLQLVSLSSSFLLFENIKFRYF